MLRSTSILLTFENKIRKDPEKKITHDKEYIYTTETVKNVWIKT